MRNSKRFLALLLAASMVIPALPAWAAETGGDPPGRTGQEVTVPKPYYEFTFDNEVTDNKVENEGTKTGVSATIEGSGEGLGVVEDEARNSKVLNLPGGKTNGAIEGRLTLPENMFADVGEDGFAFSFWINIDSTAGQYNRIFSATVGGQNSDNGGGAWNAPEFAFVAGSETATDMGPGQGGYHTSVVLPDRSAQLKLVWEQQFARAKWQHVTISVSPTSYDIYLDGQAVDIKYDRNNNTTDILQKLFNNNAEILKKYKYCGIGPSVYKTDKDLKAKMDEFRFYNTALTSEQAKKAYDDYKVSSEVIQRLQDKIKEVEAKSISFYTRESYKKLQNAIAEGKAGIENPVTQANVERLIQNLDTASSELAFYEGVTADTKFSKAQLEKEKAEAEKILAQGGLTEESEGKLQAAVDAAEKAAAGTDQTAVDQALLAVREAVDTKSYGPTLHFDMTPDKGKELFHGSTGFLYGVSEIGVPSVDLIKGIAPKILVQKAADGQQHPSGDGYRLTSYLLDSCGAENIQIYLQDYYLQWPYESKGIDDYDKKVYSIVSNMVKGKSAAERSRYSFVIFNEPDNIWYGGKFDTLCKDWLQIYKTIKEIDPALKVAGPNFASYNSGRYNDFLKYCKENNCLPEYITWHELQKDKLASFKSHADQVKEYVKTYYKDSDIKPILFVNEVANFEDVGNPGTLVNWLSIFEEEDVYASLPYWGLENSLNELAADTNKPNGAWWVYKWYAQMTGNKAPMTLENVKGPNSYGRLYGLTSADEKAGMMYSLFGGEAGRQTVSIENIGSTEMFKGADKAHVKLYSTKYTGHHGFADDIPVEFEGNLPIVDGKLVLSVSDAELMDAYFAVITPATSEETSTIAGYGKNWEMTYEAEKETLLGTAAAYVKTGGSDLARSNRAEVGHLNAEGDGVQFGVDVPKDGRYRLNIYYTSQAPQVNPLTLEYVADGGQNRAIGAQCRHSLTIDGGEPQEIVYDSTVKWGYYNYKTVYVDLKKGSHTIQLMYKGEDQNAKKEKSMLCALLDKIDLTYAPDKNAAIQIEPEELVGTQEGYTLNREGTFTGSGSAKGSGEFEFYVNVPRDGYYTIASKGSGIAALSKSKLNYAQNARAESKVSLSWQNLLDITLGSTNAGMVYLTAGVNRLRLNGNNLILDQITFIETPEATKGNSIVKEAEDCKTEGTDTKDDYNYLLGSKAVPEVIETTNASGEKAVEGFRGGKDNSLTLDVTVTNAGNYKLSVVYANNEPAPVMKKQDGSNYVHPYNTDLVERYMQISVNGGAPQTVYFRNTLCWDVYKNVVVDVKLNAGKNTIVFTNDNSYKFSSVQDDFTPRMDKFEIAPATTTVTTQIVTDKTGLNKAIELAEEENGKKDVYTTKSWDALQKALKEAKEAAGGNVVQTVVDEMTSALRKALRELEERTGVLKVALSNAIDRETELREENYTAESWATLQVALNTAKELRDDPAASQEDVNKATQALREAFEQLKPSDKTGLQAAIEHAYTLVQEDYPENTVGWTAMENARTEAEKVNGNPNAAQEEIDEATRKLYAAVFDLDPEKINKNGLNVAINRAKALNGKQDNYTASGWAALQEALLKAEEVSANNEAVQQDIIDATVALRKALRELEKVDKSGLNAAIARALELKEKEEDYKDKADKWNVMIAELTSAEELAADKNAVQTDVDAATYRLSESIRQLEAKTTVDKDELKVAVERTKALDKNIYTETTWDKLEKAVENANKLLKSEEVTQEQLDEATREVRDAIIALEGANKAELNVLISLADKEKAEDYTAESWAAMQDALNAARPVSENPDATQQQIDDASAQLNEALQKLEKVEKNTVNKDVLREKYNQAKDIKPDGYTAESYAALKKALEEAEAVLNKETATQSEVHAQTQALDDAIKALKKEEEKPSAADKSSLQKKYTDAKAIKSDGYTAESYAALTKALTAAKAVLDKETATQAEVDAQVKALDDAVKALKKTGSTGQTAVKVSRIKISAISGKIAAGKKIQLTAAITPSNATNKNVTWKSSNTKVATVDSKGLVKIKSKTGGRTVTITATAADGSGKKATYKIKVMKGVVKKIAISGKKSVKAGKKLQLKAKVTATKNANKKVKWTSSNTRYAKVNSKGKVTALKAGKGKTVKITAMATDGSGKKKTVKIKIK